MNSNFISSNPQQTSDSFIETTEIPFKIFRNSIYAEKVTKLIEKIENEKISKTDVEFPNLKKRKKISNNELLKQISDNLSEYLIEITSSSETSFTLHINCNTSNFLNGKCVCIS